MTYTKLQKLQAERTKLLAQLKNVQTSHPPDVEAEAKLIDLLEANSVAIYKTRPKELDLPRGSFEDKTSHRPDDWVNIN